jgi:type VI secretion system protein ImpJ
MTNLSKLVWSEGMYLGPHHFQAQARYFEDSMHFLASALSFAPYGLIGCGLDEQALRNGTVSVLHARGIFPDGLVFYMPESDPLPEPRPIADVFPPIASSLTIYLGISGYDADAPNYSGVDGVRADARFVSETQTIADETTGSGDKRIQIARKNIRLFLESEIAEGTVAIPLARVLRDGSGEFVYDSHFIPPTLQISGSARLMGILERLIGILEEKHHVLAPKGISSGSTRAGFSPGEIASFWFLHAINSSIGPLRHLFYSTRTHPEKLYVTLARLAGSLCTFATDANLKGVPAYNHNKLSECFDSLDAFIRKHLELVIPTNCVSVQFALLGDYIYGGSVLDSRCFGRSQWILSIRSSMPEAELISRTPQAVKVCSGEFIRRLVQQGIGGLDLTHLSVPPAGASPRIDRQYFAIAQQGPCWNHIVQTKSVGIYVAAEITDVDVEISVLMEGQNP